jgi:hypothetical protein
MACHLSVAYNDSTNFGIKVQGGLRVLCMCGDDLLPGGHFVSNQE